MHVQIYLDVFNRNRSEKIETYKLNEKLGTKKVFKTYFVGSDKSLWNVFKEILSSSDSFSTIIFNQPQENVFSEKGLESGVLTVYYSVSYWSNHLMYNLQDGTSVYTGIINAKDNQIMSFAQQVTKSYVDDKILIVNKTLSFPEGITTRDVVETSKGFIDTKGKRLIGYVLKSARTGLEIHIQTLTVDSSGKCTLVYDKQSEQAFDVEITFTFM